MVNSLERVNLDIVNTSNLPSKRSVGVQWSEIDVTNNALKTVTKNVSISPKKCEQFYTKFEDVSIEIINTVFINVIDSF